MKLKLERFGGLAGIPLVIEIDVERLPRVEAVRLKRLVAEGEIFSLEEVVKVPAAVPLQADQFVYRICLEQEGRIKTIEMDEESVPASCRPLVQHLVKLAKK